MDDKGGGVKVNADIGWQRGVGVLANAEITEKKCIKMAKNMVNLIHWRIIFFNTYLLFNGRFYEAWLL